MIPIDVEPDAFEAASQVFGQDITAQLTQAITGLEHGLAGTAAMAGTDPGGTRWAGSYDKAASDTFSALTAASGSCFHVAAALEKSGFNHSMAESHSDPTKQTPVPQDTTKYSPPATTYPAPPSAAGGSSSPPTGWGLIEHLVGYVWPNGDQGKLHTAAQVWSTAAGILDTASADVPQAVQVINSQQSAEVDDAVNVCQSMGQHIRDIADACRGLSSACSNFAAAIANTHSQVEQELVSLVEWTVGIEAGGALLGAISFGLGEAAAQGAEAGRIAATAARVSSIISRLVETAGAVGDAIESVTTKIAEILSKLKTILRMGTEDAEITGATADDEVGALKRLEQGCFLPGTMVLTEAGLRPIEQVTAGDLVVATDPHTGVQRLRPVRATMTHTAFGIIDIEVAGTRISCTSDHPFWVHAKGWTKAADLAAGDVLLDAEFQPHAIDAVTSRPGAYTVHNLDVDDLHAYHVSCATILVHNKAMRIRPENPTLRDAKWLKKNGIDPHTVKEILPGPVSRFDIYVDRNGNVWGVAKGANPNDGEFLGNLEDFK